MTTTVFVAGCNFSCPYCHNPELVSTPTHPATIPFSQIEEHLAKKIKWLDGVVLSGGEPTLYRELPALVRRIRKLGLGIKIDTNGSRPDVLEWLIGDKLVGCVAMDVKTSLDRYGSVARRPVSIEAITRSIQLIIDSPIQHEFRTTMMPSCVDSDDVLEIAQMLRRADRYVLQQFNPKVVLDPEASRVEPYSSDHLTRIADDCCKYLPTVVRGA